MGALFEEVLRLALAADAGEVALHVGAEDRHTGIGEAFRQDLQRDRLAGAGRARHQPVAVAVFQVQIFALVDAVVGLRLVPIKIFPSCCIVMQFAPLRAKRKRRVCSLNR